MLGEARHIMLGETQVSEDIHQAPHSHTVPSAST